MEKTQAQLVHSKQIANLLGVDLWQELLSCLPDAFFYLEPAAQEIAWREILKAIVNTGERNPERLANMVEVF